MSAEETMAHLRVQEYLDDVSELDMPSSQTEWYNVDVASLLNGSKVLGHEVDQCTGDSLLFLERSVMLCSPSAGKMQHFPKHLLTASSTTIAVSATSTTECCSAQSCSRYPPPRSNSAGSAAAAPRWRSRMPRAGSLAG